MDPSFAITGYPVSRDYDLLAFLMQRQSLLCIVDYGKDGGIRDVGKTLWSADRSGGVWQLSARGIGYIYAFSREEFIAECAKANVEFIVPKL